MARRGRSIILLLAALWLAPAAIADGAESTTVARQAYAYDPGTGTVTLDLTTVYSGRDADNFRGLYGRMGRDGYSKAKLDYYRTMYNTVAEAAPPAVRDYPDRVETLERYTFSLADPDDDDLKHRFPIYPDLLRGFFSSLPATIQQPYGLDGALDRRDIVIVTAPTLGTYEVRNGGVSDSYFTFSRTASTRSGQIELDYRLRFLTDRVPATDFERYRADIERMDHNIYAWIDLDRDFYRRYYREMPTIAGGVAAACLVTALAGGWWLAWRRSKGS